MSFRFDLRKACKELVVFSLEIVLRHVELFVFRAIAFVLDFGVRKQSRC